MRGWPDSHPGQYWGWEVMEGTPSSGLPPHRFSRGSVAEDPESKELGTMGTNPDGLSEKRNRMLPTQACKGVQERNLKRITRKKLGGLDKSSSGSLARERCNCRNSEEMQSDLGRTSEGRNLRELPVVNLRECKGNTHLIHLYLFTRR
jgi:hypothetical protein